jgi:hypothetical protein
MMLQAILACQIGNITVVVDIGAAHAQNQATKKPSLHRLGFYFSALSLFAMAGPMKDVEIRYNKY